MVFGSDSQVTTGPVRTKGTKIRQLNDLALWGASGEVALIQRVAEKIEDCEERDHPLAILRDILAGHVKESMEALIDIDFRTQFAKDPDSMLQLHPGDFLFVEYRMDSCHTLHVTTPGVAEWVDGRACTGNGAVFAHALLSKYADITMTRDKAKLLVYKVIEEAIEVGSWGVGPPIHIWDVSADGVHQASPEEIDELGRDAARLRIQEVELISKPKLRVETTPPAPSQCPNAALSLAGRVAPLPRRSSHHAAKLTGAAVLG